MSTAEAKPTPKTKGTPKSGIVGDLWGGIAATLVALPAAVAFGVAVYGPVAGPGAGALAGLLGATALGITAPLLGGTPRLVSAPCAPAVAVMSAFGAAMLKAHPGDPGRVLVLMALVGLFAGALQIGFGLVRAGTIIKYIPYPVVTGYLSGVGVVIFLKQLPSVLGLPAGMTAGKGVLTPSAWQIPAIVVAVTTIAVMVLAPKVTKAVPPAILGLVGGILAYVGLALAKPELRVLAKNTLVIGPLGGDGASFVDALRGRVAGLGSLHASDVGAVVGPALTLAVLLSLDTLKTCVVVDAMTGTRHESNRELFGQGCANTLSAVMGGMPGAGTSGPTLVALASGARTRWAAVLEGAAVLLAFLFLGRVVAWAPLAALSGILVVVAFRMFDWGVFRWALRKSTALDLVVVVAVIGVAVFVDLISASAVGVALSILLFIRNESRGAVIRRKLTGSQILSKRRRLPEQVDVLTTFGGETLVVQLEGSLFFGTTDQLRAQLQPDLAKQRTIIVDMRRVDTVDMTAVHILEQMRAQLRDRGATMVFCNLPRTFSGGRDALAYLTEVGLFAPGEKDAVFDQLSDALAWAEERILAEHGTAPGSERPLEIMDMPMFQGRKPETVKHFLDCVEERHVPTGDFVFRHGETTDEIFFVRVGSVRISLPIGERRLHVASFGQGDFFGEIAFLDGGARTADAIAETETYLYAISRAKFDQVAAQHPRLGQALFAGLARALALRLRHADREITTLEES